MELDPLRLVLLVAVDADDDALAVLDLLLPVECRLLDLRLHEAPLDRLDGASELVDALDQLPGARLQLGGERLDVVRAAERIRGRGRPTLGGEDLLRAQGDACRALGRQRERLVERVRVQ